MNDDDALLILLRCGAPAAGLRALLDGCGTPGAALRAGPAAWRGAGFEATHAAALRAPDRHALDRDRAWLEAPAHHLIGWHHTDYPALLRSAVRPPAALFVVGDPVLLWHPQVAVVGSRHPTAGGRENAQAFARQFGMHGLTVTSGLAEGIDSAAHLGALETLRTIAVLGTGPDRCFPAVNAGLMARIAETGALVSEHPPGTFGIRQHFPSRNRIIAGLALGTVVVEAAVRSGALITARLASEAGREVFALPGSIHNPMARGCHRLLRTGAGLAESPEDVIEALAPVAESLAGSLRGRLAGASEGALPGAEGLVPTTCLGVPDWGRGIGEAERSILRQIGHDPVNLDQLCRRTGLTVGPLSAMLLAMELDGKISAAHGRYSRRS